VSEGVNSDFTFGQLETDEDIQQYLQLMRNVFGGDSRVDLMVEKWIRHHPRMTLEDFFVAKHLGKVVAGLCLIPTEWSIGGVPLKVAELGCVATLQEYRRRGLQRGLMAEYDNCVREQEYDISAIEGIPFFYRQFGYEYALPLDERISIKLDKIPDSEIKETVRFFEMRDLQEAMKLLTKSQQKFYVHSIRDEKLWRLQQETGMVAENEFDGYSVEKDHSMSAYFRTSQNPEKRELCLREITNMDPCAADSVMQFLKQKGLQNGLERLVCTISHDEPFAKHLMASRHAKQSRPYAWQIRISDHLTILRKMKTLFEKRLESSDYNCLTSVVNLSFYQYTIQLKIERGKINSIESVEDGVNKTVRFNPNVFPQLLLGYRSREQLEHIYPDFIVQPAHRKLIDILFPKKSSFIHTVY